MDLRLWWGLLQRRGGIRFTLFRMNRTKGRALAILIALVWLRAGAAAEGGTGVRIGNFHYRATNGIAFIKDDAAAFVIDPERPANVSAAVVGPAKDGGMALAVRGGADNAGIVSPDGSYNRVILPQADASFVVFEWSRVGDGVVARLVAEKPGKIVFRLDRNWPNLSSEYSAAPDGVKGIAKTAAGEITWTLKAKPAPVGSDATSFTLPLGGATAPTYFAAGFGELAPLDGLDAKIDDARRSYEARRPRAVGPGGDIVGAITNNLNNTRLYNSEAKQIGITVSRTFDVKGPNLAPYFCWDSFFNGLLASLDNPEAARQTVRIILSAQGENGYVPNFTWWASGTSPHSQPPVGAMCVWKMHQRQPDVEFLREVYPKLSRWHAWWMKERSAKGDGLLQWGSSSGKPQMALYECGWDDTPHFREMPGVTMVGQVLNVYAVDLCSLWAMDAQYLALMADVLGEKSDAEMFRRQAKEMNERINAKLWNEELGIYCSRFWDNEDGSPGKFLTRLTPANFYPLICGAPSADQAKRMLAIMTDPEQFWGEWVLPTVSRKDPLFAKQRYWCGTVWPPVNYLVFQGLKRYAPPELQAEFAQKSVRLFMNNWLGSGMCGENFFSTSGRVGSNPNYTWGALLCLIGVEAVADIDDAGKILAGSGYNEPVTLENMPAGGKRYRAIVKYGTPAVSVEAGAPTSRE